MADPKYPAPPVTRMVDPGVIFVDILLVCWMGSGRELKSEMGEVSEVWKGLDGGAPSFLYELRRSGRKFKSVVKPPKGIGDKKRRSENLRPARSSVFTVSFAELSPPRRAETVRSLRSLRIR